MTRVLLDEMVDERLAGHLPEGVEGATVKDMFWESRQNGELLRLAADTGFDAMLTLDKNMQHQQNEATLPLPVIVMHPPPQSQRFKDLKEVVSNHVAGLLYQEKLENRFYNVGPGYHSDEGRGDG